MHGVLYYTDLTNQLMRASSSPVRTGRRRSGLLASGPVSSVHLRHPPLPAGPVVCSNNDVAEDLLPCCPCRTSFFQQPADLSLLPSLHKSTLQCSIRKKILYIVEFQKWKQREHSRKRYVGSSFTLDHSVSMWSPRDIILTGWSSNHAFPNASVSMTTCCLHNCQPKILPKVVVVRVDDRRPTRLRRCGCHVGLLCV